ncbi:hypothetical protein LOY46_06800 [Pseudomonas sichuanensis]|uniref:hypothetical protein n=1 Tax=Pseudomonas sichuanensis TaxID=2213015 RepID=UPI00215E56B5|nr:hypothetical protein [Pseudomonas sichuanensis]UVK84401.1 hypothetical protein LOY46_06800 [Pseudomonas sichuanensis]
MRDTREVQWLQADLATPDVPVIIRDENGDPYSDGLLPRTALSNDLEVIIAPWDMDPQLSDKVQVGWRFSGAPFVAVSEYTFAPPSAQRTVHVPRRYLEHGVYDLSYTVSRLGNLTESLKRTITVDRLPPNDGQSPDSLVLPADLVGELTEDYLALNGRLRCEVPTYVGLKARDRAVFFWSAVNPPPGNEPAIDEREFSQQDIDRGELFVDYDAAAIRASGSGQRFLWYRLRDLAGNEGDASLVTALEVSLQPPPANLRPPRVPLSARGLIDREHAREGASGEGGVTVEVDAYDNADVQQWVIIDWHGTPLQALAVDPAAFPLRAFVPWPALTAVGLGPGDAVVSYQVRHGTRLLPSPSISVPFDLTVAGQDHPNAPALLNTLLDKVEIRGAVSDQPNVLKPVDHGYDAIVKLALFNDPQPGDLLSLYWGQQLAPVDRYSVQPGDVAGQPVALKVPWAVIEQQPNDRALPVWYETDNGVNQQLSRATLVDVAVEVIQGLKAPVFPDATLYGYLNCCSRPRLWEGVNVRVEGDPRFSVGDIIELVWQGHDNLNGSSPIPGVTAPFSKPVATAGGAVDFLILPYDTLIAPMIDNASATAQYRLLKTDGSVGVSEIDVVKIMRKMPSGEVCSPDLDLCLGAGTQTPGEGG